MSDPKNIDDGGPAFPGQWKDFQPTTGVEVTRDQWSGISKREFFAAFALNAIHNDIAAIFIRAFSPSEILEEREASYRLRKIKEIGETAVAIADSVLEALGTTKT